MFAITNGRIIADDGIIENKCIIIDKGSILSVSEDIPSNIDVIDAEGNFISPGFVDIHIHGAGGCDIMDGSCDSINTISKSIAEHGTTSFVATTMTAHEGDIKTALNAVRECMKRGTDGANVLGAHLEGPFLNVKTKGAHTADFIKDPDINFLINLTNDDFSVIKSITVAPEVPGAMDLIRFINGHGIVVSIGHSDGSYDDVMKAIVSGACHSTHLYNAMRSFNHREPGVIGAIFDSRITTEFIADGIHVHFAAIRTAIATKGYENCALVSDAMRACCMEDGIYSLGGQDVFVKDGAARLREGVLAGSTLTLDTAVRNIMRNTSLNIVEAVAMATKVPSRICKLKGKGIIKPGYDADIIIFDSDINIQKVIIGGSIIA